MQITDRAKDVIKSGGEWIILDRSGKRRDGSPGVAQAAVIGVPHPKWLERPLLIVVLKRLADSASREALLDFLHRESRAAGGCPMTWFSWMNCHTPLRARYRN